MAYVAPTITGSGATFAQLQQNGLSGHIELLIGANSFTATQKSMLRAIVHGQAQFVFKKYRDELVNYTSGQPVAQATAKQYVLDFNTVMAALSALAAEAGTLVDANAGTLGYSAIIGNTFPKQQRTFP